MTVRRALEQDLDQVRSIADSDIMWQWKCTEEIQPFRDDDSFCVIGSQWNATKTKGIVWGDSHSLHWAPALHHAAKERNISLIIAPKECPAYLESDFVKEFYPEFPNFTEDCTKKHRMTVAWLNDTPEVQVIIMAAAWSGHVRQLYSDDEPHNHDPQKLTSQKSSAIGGRLSLSALSRTIDRLDLNGKQLLLLGDMPRPNRNLNDCAFNDLTVLLRGPCEQSHTFLDAAYVRAWHEHSDEVLKEIAATHESVTAILPTSALCDERMCPTYLNDELLYMDSNHMRRNLHEETWKVLNRTLGLPVFFNKFKSTS